MSVASMVADANSIPAKVSPVYTFTGFPPALPSATSAASHSADQVSTVTSV